MECTVNCRQSCLPLEVSFNAFCCFTSKLIVLVQVPMQNGDMGGDENGSPLNTFMHFIRGEQLNCNMIF